MGSIKGAIQYQRDRGENYFWEPPISKFEEKKFRAKSRWIETILLGNSSWQCVASLLNLVQGGRCVHIILLFIPQTRNVVLVFMFYLLDFSWTLISSRQFINWLRPCLLIIVLMFANLGNWIRICLVIQIIVAIGNFIFPYENPI